MAPPSSKTKLILLGLVTIALAITIIRLYSTPTPTLDNLTIKIADTNYQLQIADTVATRSQGLSNRRSLCPSCGMLFVFPRSGFYPFWMKDTLIPLDIVWLDEQGIIVHLNTDTPPQGNTPTKDLPLYQNLTPARYVIELNAGDVARLQLSIGDTLDISSALIP